MTRPDFTIEDVLAWARTKPAGEAYDFLSPKCCAIAQFGEATNRPHLINLANVDVYSKPLRLAIMSSGCSVDWTFGKLVKRLEKLCPETPAKPVSDTWIKVSAYLNDIESVEV